MKNQLPNLRKAIALSNLLFGHADNQDAHPINITRYGGYDHTSIEQTVAEQHASTLSCLKLPTNKSVH